MNAVVETDFQRTGLDFAVVVGRRLGSEAQVPLADHAGGIAGLLEQRRHRDAPRFDDQRRDARQDARALLAPGVLAGHKGVARRRADRRRRVRVGEPQPLRGKPIDVRRLDLRRAIAAEVAIADIVGQNEEDIRLRHRRFPSVGELNGKNQAGQQQCGEPATRVNDVPIANHDSAPGCTDGSGLQKSLCWPWLLLSFCTVWRAGFLDVEADPLTANQ